MSESTTQSPTKPRSVSYTDEEWSEIAELASRAGVSVSNWVRARTGHAPLKRGAREGNCNNPAGSPEASTLARRRWARRVVESREDRDGR